MSADNIHSCQPNWTAFTGTILPGGYEVGSIVEAERERARFHARVLGDWSANALIDAFCADESQAEEQVRLWTAAKDLQHPNLSSPLAAGELESPDARLIYVVAPGADETLAGAVRERSVTVEEARQILTSVRSALEYLHSHGWVHGHLSPEQVLAVGDSIRIPTACAGQINAVRPVELMEPKYVAPEASAGNVTPAADIWCLGATLFEALAQQVFTPERLQEATALPKPFDRIVERCVDPNPQTRWTLEQMAGAAADRPITPVRIEPEAIATAPLSKQEESPRLTRIARHGGRAEGSSLKLWLYAVAAGLLVLLLVLWASKPRNRQYVPVQAKAVPTPVTPPDPAPATPKSAWETKTLAPPTQLAPATTRPAAKIEERTPTVNGPVWRVVVFTFTREADAQKRAQLVNEKHPRLDAKVFAPEGPGSAYLVTVGGTMTREQAQQLRRRVIGMGLPHDSYIQNYKQ